MASLSTRVWKEYDKHVILSDFFMGIEFYLCSVGPPYNRNIYKNYLLVKQTLLILSLFSFFKKEKRNRYGFFCPQIGCEG